MQSLTTNGQMRDPVKRDTYKNLYITCFNEIQEELTSNVTRNKHYSFYFLHAYAHTYIYIHDFCIISLVLKLVTIFIIIINEDTIPEIWSPL